METSPLLAETRISNNSYSDNDAHRDDVVVDKYGTNTDKMHDFKRDTSWSASLKEFSSENLGVFASYFSVGVVAKLHQTPVQYYLISTLDASSVEYSAYATIHRLPWSMKFIFGFLSDNFEILGSKRKSWLIIGWVSFTLVNIALFILQTPTLIQTVALVFLFTVFLVMADVSTDTLSVEKSRSETNHSKGNMQSIGFIFRAMGRVLGAVGGTYLYENGTSFSFDIAQIFLLDALFPILCVGAFIVSLSESPHGISDSIQVYFRRVWHVLQLEAVWRPMVFIYVYNMMMIPNSSWSNFLVLGLGFSDAQLGYLSIVSAVVGLVGYISFRALFFHARWRKIYYVLNFVGIGFMLLQISLILRLNTYLGIPDIFLAVGDEVIAALMEGIAAMPITIMFLMLCPPGAEGTTFAIMTTMSSLAGTVGGDMGTILAAIVDVTNDQLESGDFSGVLILTVATGLVRGIPLLFLHYLPDTREDHKKAIDLGKSNESAGYGLVSVVVVSLLFTIGLNVIALV